MKNFEVVLLLPIVAFVNSAFAQITRNDMIGNARDYLDLVWTPNADCVEQLETAERPVSSNSAFRVNDFRNLINVLQTGMAYGWGCWTEPTIFTNRISIGTPENLFATDCNSQSGSDTITYAIAMGRAQNIENFFSYNFTIQNTGANPIYVKISEKYSGQDFFDFRIVDPNESETLKGWPGFSPTSSYTQTLSLRIEPYFLGDAISWNANGCWSRKANQDRYAPGAHDEHWPTGASSPENWAVGIDCSGLVGRAWELSSKPSTNSLYSNYYPVNTQQVAIADILVDPGVHTVIIEWLSGDVMLLDYIHSCGALGVDRVENAILQDFLMNGYFMRSYFQPTSVEENTESAGSSFNLASNFPNPFNPSTTIRFAVPQKSLISLAIYDERGGLVRELASDRLYQPGWSEVVWDGTNASGLPVSSGVYFYRMHAQGLHDKRNFTQARKLTLIK